MIVPTLGNPYENLPPNCVLSVYKLEYIPLVSYSYWVHSEVFKGFLSPSWLSPSWVYNPRIKYWSEILFFFKIQRLGKPNLQDQTAGKTRSETRRRTCLEVFNRGKDFKVGAVLSRNIWGIWDSKSGFPCHYFGAFFVNSVNSVNWRLRLLQRLQLLQLLRLLWLLWDVLLSYNP